eukprot:gene10082-biopygen5194
MIPLLANQYIDDLEGGSESPFQLPVSHGWRHDAWSVTVPLPHGCACRPAGTPMVIAGTSSRSISRVMQLYIPCDERIGLR